MTDPSDDFFSSVIDAAPDGILIVDGDGTIRFANRQAVAMFATDGLVGSPVDDLLPGDLRSGHRAHREHYLAEPAVRPMGVGMLLRALRADGTEFPVEISLSPLHDHETFLIVAVVRDVSARVEAEEQMRAVLRTLDAAELQIAVADDRERIARDLHDTVIQRLFASGLALQAATARAEPDVARRLEGVIDDLDETIREIRTAIFSLQPKGPDAALRTKIVTIVGEAAHNLGFEPRLRFDGVIENIDTAVADELLPTLREALTNVAKHASASSVEVSVLARPDEVRLVVTDDGVGPEGQRSGGHGLDNMAARAARVGGMLVVEPAPEKGTRLVWFAPAAAS